MDFVFLRVDEETFKLIPTRSCSRSETRLISLVVEWEVDDLLRNKRFFDKRGYESGKRHPNYSYWDPSKKIISYAMRYPKYKFWEMIEFPQGTFQYQSHPSVEELFKGIVDQNKSGMTMMSAINEIPKLLKWQQL